MRGPKERKSLVKNKDLPLDLWGEVLCRFPVKTLLKLRCVSKLWCSMIDSPDFASMHRKHYTNDPSNTQVLTRENRGDETVFMIRRMNATNKTFKCPLNYSEFQFICASYMVDGLILMKLWSMKRSKICLGLWNPSLHKSLLLPPCTYTSNVKYGLGYAPGCNDYKVVGLRKWSNPAALELSIAVYSLRDHRWRHKPKWINAPIKSLSSLRLSVDGVYAQGAMYWKLTAAEEETRLVRFDFDAETFSLLELPQQTKYETMIKSLFRLDGCIAVFGISSTVSCICVMEKNGSKQEWRQHFFGGSNSASYELFKICSSDPTNTKILYCGSKGGTFLLRRKCELMSYNITSHKIRHLHKSISFFSVEAYVESLVLKNYKSSDLSKYISSLF